MIKQAHQHSGELRLRRLHWLCRRGMKELDVLLENFISNQSAAMDRGSWPELESLLIKEDDQLWDLIRNPAAAPREYQIVLNEIRHGLAQPD